MLEYTGERYMPCVTGQYQYEHLHRYALSLPVVSGKLVLDIASGEGYGAALLARNARAVTGVDIDAAAVQHAREQYADHSNLQFLEGSCAAIPLPDQSVEVVVSFETIEHHDQHEEMLLEIKRVLKPGGVLVISSPNKLVYSDIPQLKNHYHVKELYYDEFDQLLSRHFKHQRLYGQRLSIGSFVYDLRNNENACLKAYSGNTQTLRESLTPLEDTVYFLAVCSDSEANLPTCLPSVFNEPAEDLLKQLHAEHAQEKRVMREVWEAEAQAALAQKSAEMTQYYEPIIARLNADMQTIVNSRAFNLVQQIWRWRARLPFGRSRTTA